MLPVAAILSIISVCCIVYCCRKYKKRTTISKGFRNIASYGPATIGAGTLDRKAMLETSSDNSDHYRTGGNHVYDGPGQHSVSDSFPYTARVTSAHFRAHVLTSSSPPLAPTLPRVRQQMDPDSSGSTPRRRRGSEHSLEGRPGPGGPGSSFAAMPPQVVIPRARHPNQVNYAIHRGQVYMW